MKTTTKVKPFMESGENLVFPLLRKVMKVFQVWPTKERAPVLRCLILAIYSFGLHVPMMRYTYFYRHDFIEFSLGLCEVLSLFLMASKFASFFFFNDTVKEVIDELEDMWSEAKRNGNKTWQDIDLEHQRLTKRNTKVVIGIYFTAACNYAVVPFMIFLFHVLVLKNPGNEFTLGLHVDIYGLNYRNNIVVYSYFVVPYIILFLSFAITHGCATRFISAVIDYGATYFKYICTELEQFDEDYERLKMEQRELLIKKIIKDHQKGLKICELVETSFNLNFLFQFAINIFYICFILFDLNILIDDPELLTNLVMFLMAIQSDLIMCSVFGQQMIDESLNVAVVAYNTRWYEMDLNTRKMMILIILRAQRCSGVTAGKFYFMGYETYGHILSTAFSYYLILRNLYHE